MAVTPRLTYFVSTDSQPRVRRAADAITVIVGVLLVIWGVVGVERLPPWEQALTDLLTTLPSWAMSLFSMGYLFGLFYGLGILVAILAGGRERRGALRDVTLALVGAGVGGALLGLAVTGSWPYVIPELGLESPDPRFPMLRVVLVTAILVAASPHLSRPMRRLGWVTIMITALAGIGLGYGNPSDAVGALGIGLVAAGMVLLVAGSPRGYPDPASVLMPCKPWVSPPRMCGSTPRSRGGCAGSPRRLTANRSPSRCTGATPPTPSWRQGCGERSGTGRAGRHSAIHVFRRWSARRW